MMAKAVLVLDMPRNCYECLFCMFTADRKCECFQTGKRPEELFTRADWCPLIPEPNRREPGDAIEFTEGEPLTDELADKIFNFGFNECLAVIEEMAEEWKENE